MKLVHGRYHDERMADDHEGGFWRDLWSWITGGSSDARERRKRCDCGRAAIDLLDFHPPACAWRQWFAQKYYR